MVGSASGIWAPRGARVRNLSLLGPEGRADKWEAHTLWWETKPPQPVWGSNASLVSSFQTSCWSWMWGHRKWSQATYLKAVWVYSFHRCLFFFSTWILSIKYLSKYYPCNKAQAIQCFLGERHDLSSLHWGESCALFVWPSMQLSLHLRLRFRCKFS